MGAMGENSSVTWTATRASTEALVVSWTVEDKSATQWFLLRSDAHHDHALCDRDLERRHLDEAKKLGAGILDAGDLHCAMQGKWDPRSSRSALRPELQVGQYLDELVDQAAEFYSPYGSHWIMMSPGNHEESIAKRHETHLTDRTVQALKDKAGSPVHRMPYTGWVIFRIRKRDQPKKVQTLRLKYHHGYGGGGPVTRGVIQTNRQAVYLPDADVVWSGHTHDQWMVPIQRERVTSSGRVYQDRQVHLKSAGYKDEYTGGEGWHHHRGAPPKPLGAWWLIVRWCSSNDSRPDVEFREAV